MYDNINMCIDVMIQYVGQGTEGPTIPPFVFRGYMCLFVIIYVYWCHTRCVCFVDRCLLVLFWQLGCLSFLDLRILITSLLSSNSSSISDDAQFCR
jgi:hypothetical protein